MYDVAKAALEKSKIAACSLDRDDACGAHYTVKDGSGLRIVYRRGTVVYTAVTYGYDRRWGRYPP